MTSSPHLVALDPPRLDKLISSNLISNAKTCEIRWNPLIEFCSRDKTMENIVSILRLVMDTNYALTEKLELGSLGGFLRACDF